MPNHFRLTSFFVVLCCVSFVLVAGCKKEVPVSSVSGKVTLNGEPFGHGSICFINPSSGTSGVAFMNDDGTYKFVAPIPVGDYSVYIAGYKPLPPNEVDTRKMPPFPKKYASHRTSGWTFSIIDGENNADFNMEK